MKNKKEALDSLELGGDYIDKLIKVIDTSREAGSKTDYEVPNRIPKAVPSMWLPTVKIASLPYVYAETSPVFKLDPSLADCDVHVGLTPGWYPPQD